MHRVGNTELVVWLLIYPSGFAASFLLLMLMFWEKYIASMLGGLPLSLERVTVRHASVGANQYLIIQAIFF